jgi:hypothetical protein
MEWHIAVSTIEPSIIKIETPSGWGTGFLCAYNHVRTFVGFATARHVVEEADKWQQPIRLQQVPSGEVILLKEADRVILPDPDPRKDSAVIIMPTAKIPAKFKLPETPVPLFPAEKYLRVGINVGWLGYPVISDNALCFFTGNVSAWRNKTEEYLIDGVVINGVSGGPVLCSRGGEAPALEIIGAITAYISNRATGATLPGLSVAQDISHFQRVVTSLTTQEEATQKKKEQGEAEPTIAPEPPTPLPSPNEGNS